MSTKTATYTGLFIGSTIGSFIPMLWGGDMFDMSAILLSAVFGILGIVIGYKIAVWYL